jgi:hypothetical protein
MEGAHSIAISQLHNKLSELIVLILVQLTNVSSLLASNQEYKVLTALLSELSVQAISTHKLVLDVVVLANQAKLSAKYISHQPQVSH